MWKELYGYIAQLVKLKGQTDKNTADIEAIRQEMKDLTAAVQELSYEIRRVDDNAAHERDKILLRLEVILLRYDRGERQLPALPALGGTEVAPEAEQDTNP